MNQLNFKYDIDAYEPIKIKFVLYTLIVVLMGLGRYARLMVHKHVGIAF